MALPRSAIAEGEQRDPTISAVRGIAAALRHAESELLRVQAALSVQMQQGGNSFTLSTDIQRLDSATQGVAGTAAFAEALIRSLELGVVIVPAALGDPIRPRDLRDRLLLARSEDSESGEAAFF